MQKPERINENFQRERKKNKLMDRLIDLMGIKHKARLCTGKHTTYKNQRIKSNGNRFVITNSRLVFPISLFLLSLKRWTIG